MKKIIKLQSRKTTSPLSKKKPYHKIYQITVPLCFVKKLGWKKGDEIYVSSSPDSNYIRMRVI